MGLAVAVVGIVVADCACLPLRLMMMLHCPAGLPGHLRSGVPVMHLCLLSVLLLHAPAVPLVMLLHAAAVPLVMMSPLLTDFEFL